MRKTTFSLGVLAAALFTVISLPGCVPGRPSLPGTAGSREEASLEPARGGEKDSQGQQGTELGHYEDVTAEDMLKARNPYIGDASADGRLISLVKNYCDIQESSVMELQTTEQPYGLTLHFQEEPDNIAVQKASLLLISLIDNCHSVSWDYPLDSAGNKEYFYLPVFFASRLAGDGAVKSYAEDEGAFIRFLEELEQITEPYSAIMRAPSVEQAVSAAILDYNRRLYPSDCEARGEGHVILDSEENEAEVTVYAQTMYGAYQFQDGNFVKDGGTGVIPAVIRLSKEPDGRYVALDYRQPMDGSAYVESIEEMFPQKLWDLCISPSSRIQESLEQQEQEYAKKYLVSIGREAAVGQFGDFPHTIPSQAGISADVSNKIEHERKFSGSGPEAYAPFWFGTIERLEDGVRYIYEHSYDRERQEIIFSKIHYETKEVEQQEIFDSITGEKKE
ncbi:MAG: DUF4825 domain-containing protein [Clostridium sp.]|nr:DUF4825 domain-containing protein [Clostridium sp.]